MWWILAWILAVAGLLIYLTDPISLFATTRPETSSETRVAVLFDAWVGSTPSDGGASVFAHLVQPLNADVFLALSHDARDGCTTQATANLSNDSAHKTSRTARRLAL